MKSTMEGQPDDSTESAVDQAKRNYTEAVNASVACAELARDAGNAATAHGYLYAAQVNATLAQAAAGRLQAEHLERLTAAVVSLGKTVAQVVTALHAAVGQLARQADAAEANLTRAKELQERLTGPLGVPPVVSEGHGLAGDILPAGPYMPALDAFLAGDDVNVDRLRRQVRMLSLDRDRWRQHAGQARAELERHTRLVVSPQKVPAGACRAPSPGGGSACVLDPHDDDVRHEDGTGGSWAAVPLPFGGRSRIRVGEWFGDDPQVVSPEGDRVPPSTAAGAPPFVCRSRIRTGDKVAPVVVCMRTDPHAVDGEHRSGYSGLAPKWEWFGDDPRVVSLDDKSPAPEVPQSGGTAPGTTLSATESAEQASDTAGQGQGDTDVLRPSEGDLGGPMAGGYR